MVVNLQPAIVSDLHGASKLLQQIWISQAFLFQLCQDRLIGGVILAGVSYGPDRPLGDI